MSKKRSIGALVVLEIPGDEKKAILQIREQRDSFPGCAQLTVHGRAEENERLSEALQRESREELAELFQRASFPIPQELEQMADTPPQPLQVVGHKTTKREKVASLSLTIHDPDFQRLIQPLIDSGVIRLVANKDVQSIVVVDPKSAEHKQHGVGGSLIGMFADERQVLEKILGTSK